MLNARRLLDTRRGGAPVAWTPTTIRHAMNAAGRFQGPRWAAGAWTLAAEASAAHRQPDFAAVALKLAEAGEDAGTIAAALNGRGYDARGGIWTAASARALVSSARALARDREAEADALALAEAAQAVGQGADAREVDRDTALLEALAVAELEATALDSAPMPGADGAHRGTNTPPARRALPRGRAPREIVQ